MTYKVKAGLPIRELDGWLDKAAAKYDLFKDGRIDYTDADIAPIVMCTVIFKNKILLVKRGHGLADAEGYWSAITGFIDQKMPLKNIVVKELKEELGIKSKGLLIKIADSYTLNSPKEKRTYIVFPCLVKLNSKPTIRLNEEHTEFRWIDRPSLESFEILDDLPLAIDSALKLL
jgi:8-oxo-dGTP pyrophosphatase MutT (NUDIX family)